MAGKNVHRQLVTLNSGVKYKQFTHVIIRDLCFLLKEGCFIIFVIIEIPRIQVVRSFLFNHLYHHRGKLIFYLRSTGNKVAGLYGPTADDKM